jgi:RNA polymerase sigma-70 factor (ECF subfamily)
MDQRRRRFDELFREHVAGIASYCRWRSGSPSDAQDAVGEVFLIAWRRLDDVPEGEAARPWLYATARGVMANQARANARRGRLHERLRAGQVPGADDAQLTERVRDALAALGPRDREVLLLAEWEGLTPAEIAVVMQRPAVSVRSRLHRARRRFRAAYDGDAPARLETGPRMAPTPSRTNTFS